MITRVYAIFDIKSGLFSQPWFFVNDNVAARQAFLEARNPSSLLHQTPADFSLYQIGEWDDAAGVLTHSSHRLIGNIGLFAQAQAEAEPVEA